MIYLSPSSLARWFNQYDLDGKLFSCPAAWNYGRQWERLEPQPIAEQGIAVHKLLEGKLSPSEVTDTQVLSMFTKIAELRETLQLKVLHAELRQEVRLLRGGVQLIRVIDAIAASPHGLVLVDYKTTPGNGWKVLPNNESPQSFGFQTTGYLLKPSQKEIERLKLYGWPVKILYLIGPARGPAQYFMVESQPGDFAELYQSAKIVSGAIRQNYFPKVKGKHCLRCPMMQVCWQTEGWEGWYRKKGKVESVSAED